MKGHQIIFNVFSYSVHVLILHSFFDYQKYTYKHVIIISRFKGFIFMYVKTYDYNVHVEKCIVIRRGGVFIEGLDLPKLFASADTQNDNCQSFIICD